MPSKRVVSEGRYAAFLRGVSPMNAKMPDLVKCFESAGFTDVATVLSSGNVVFSARRAPEASLERGAEAAMEKRLGRTFFTIVRSLADLQAVLGDDPYLAFRLPPAAKRVVTLLRTKPVGKLTLPIEEDGARILRVDERTVYSAYVPCPRGPVFMTLLERSFGRGITTRTWDTLRKVAAAAARSRPSWAPR
jgi:uncharacterized protein (DUF1697 family)